MTDNTPVDVCGFLAELRDYISKGGDDISKYDAIGRLIHVCRKYGLFVRQEYMNVDTADDDNTNKTAKTTRRVIISSDRFHNNTTHPATFQCNGLVLDSDTWEVLSYPPPSCRPIYNNKILTEGIKQSKYEIYRIRDGTILTLYWYEPENRWCMSSANGFDIGTYKWMGDTTYENAFKEIVERYEGFSFDNLDKTRSYTMGFRYHDFHPFLHDPECVWFIQSCDLAELNTNNTLNITTTIGDVPSEVAMLERQTTILVSADDADKFMKSMINECKGSINEVLRNNENKTNIVYGFIFRDTTNTYGNHSNIVIESELMKSLRRLLYNFNDVKRDKRITVNYTNRMNFIVVRSYLNYMYRPLFISLMPQFALQYEHFNNTSNQIVSKIIYYLRNHNARQRISDSRTRKNTLDEMIFALTEYVSKNGRVNVHDSNTKSIIYDMVVSPTFTHMYYKLLVEK